MAEARACRDCGLMLAPSARGCPRCALNVEAERMIERTIAGFLIALAVIAGGVLYFALR